MTSQNMIFIDRTCNLNHISIKNRAIGASEYQFYNLINELSKNNNITCYNHTRNHEMIDNILYCNLGRN